jgi:hypothetical protein
VLVPFSPLAGPFGPKAGWGMHAASASLSAPPASVRLWDQRPGRPEPGVYGPSVVSSNTPTARGRCALGLEGARSVPWSVVLGVCCDTALPQSRSGPRAASWPRPLPRRLLGAVTQTWPGVVCRFGSFES